MKIMIVEDESYVRKGIESIIRENLTISFRLTVCADSQDALASCEFSRPDLVITDIEMPGMDGLELISRMIAGNYCDRFIILSGHDNFAYARSALRYGVSDYLLKPVDREELINAIRKIFESRYLVKSKDSITASFREIPFFTWELDLSKMPASLRLIVNYMRKNYMNDISLKTISEALFFHPSYISSLINKYTGHSFGYLLDYIRLRRSAELLLEEPDLPISEVSVLVGYSNERRLYAAFQKYLSMTPGDLRNNYSEP